ncbi:hypothetical protein CB0940_09377 [Cercospora beticola]|uniref:F-box domain-containing protein n=1 Tax=Cercospora beticola TaxID=122368 RepID=A0A2G5HHW5_CERBT|nr:hypothetical protein CB0940_09377 [Cercospora beticola]PIA91793.1 hypothetical protein CB0940_09377 [Cercospora beticola]WPB06308.1 hypothetical protein RHO25_010965 [Cercospora beticola]CAK1366198.1 unnamed protein product [Cercospora beticola]
MSLLTLPAELRLRIYDYLPDLQPNRIETLTAYSNLTLAISRVNTLLRYETLIIFTSNSNFTIAMDDGPQFWLKRLTTWMNSLSPIPLSRVRSLQLSRHWNIPAPMRWQGHSGFYIRMERPRLKSEVKTFPISTSSSTDSFPSAWSNRFVKPIHEAEGNWTVTAGTYPVSKDLQGMRLESVELLAKVIRQYFAATWQCSDADEEEVGLKREDVLFLLRAMDIVAVYQNNPLVGSGPGQHRKAWLMMREKLNALEHGFVTA